MVGGVAHKDCAQSAMLSTNWFFSCSAACCILGVGLILTALWSENWTEYTVNRREILNAFNREPELNVLKDALSKNPIYFTRSQGLFYVCFPDLIPSESGTFTKFPFDAHCLPNPEYFPSEATQENFTQNQIYHLWLVRGSALLYILGLFFVLICLIVSLIGIWNSSTKLLGWGIVFALFAVFMTAGAMACWHGARYLETNTLDMSPYFRSWEPVLKSTTRSHVSWGYVLAWLGIGFLLFNVVFLVIGRAKLRKDQERELCAKQGYIMPNYFDKTAMVPYNYNTYGGYGAYPYYNQYNTGYFGYMTYGR